MSSFVPNDHVKSTVSLAAAQASAPSAKEEYDYVRLAHEAVWGDDLEALQAIYAENPEAISSRLNGKGPTPLETAIRHKRTRISLYILNTALPNLSVTQLADMLGKEGLRIAVDTNQLDVLHCLRERGVAFNLVYDGDMSLLHDALLTGDAPTAETVQFLLDTNVVPRTIQEQNELLRYATTDEIWTLINNAKVDDSWVYNGKAKASKPPAGAKSEDQKMPSEQPAQVNPPADDTKSEEKKSKPSDVLDSLKIHLNKCQTLQQQVKDAAVDKQVLALTIEMLETQITDLKARLEAAEKKAKEQRATRKRARAETEALQSQNKKLKEDLEATKGDLDATKAMNAELLEELDTAKRKLSDLCDEIFTLLAPSNSS